MATPSCPADIRALAIAPRAARSSDGGYPFVADELRCALGERPTVVRGGVMEWVKSFQEMLKEGTFAATDAMLATGVAMVVIGILAILAPLASGVLFDMFFGALFIGAGI